MKVVMKTSTDMILVSPTCRAKGRVTRARVVGAGSY